MAARNRNAALAGLAALGALMYARSRGEKEAPSKAEEVKPVRTTTSARDELEEYNKGENLDTTPGPKATPAAPAPAAAQPRSVVPAAPAKSAPAPAAVIGPRSTGIGGATAAQMAAAQMGAGGGRGGIGGPKIGEREAYEASRNKAQMAAAQMGAGGGRGGIGGPKIGEREAYEASRNKAQIPTGGPYKAPASTGKMPGETERNIRNALNAVGGVGNAARISARAGDTASTTRALAPRAAEMRPPPKELPPGSATQDRLRDFKESRMDRLFDLPMKKGGKVKGYAKGGSVRGGGCEQRGKTKGRFV